MKKYLLLAFIFSFFICAHAQEKYILTTDSVNLFINIRGKGAPCLYVHGGPGAGSYFLERLMGDYLEQHFRVIYLDQRGCGRSGSPKDKNYSMERMVKDFEEVRQSLGVKEWLTLGHSFGGLLQMGYAQKHPSVISGMIMINCTLNMKESFKTSWCPKACELLDISDQTYYLDETIPLKTRWDSLIIQLIQKDLIWKMAFSSKSDVEEMNAACSSMPRGNVDFESVAFSINDYYSDFKKLSSGLKMPVLFFYGKKDWMAGPEHYKGINFPKMLTISSDSEHMMCFLKNKTDLESAINQYIAVYDF